MNAKKTTTLAAPEGFVVGARVETTEKVYGKIRHVNFGHITRLTATRIYMQNEHGNEQWFYKDTLSAPGNGGWRAFPSYLRLAHDDEVATAQKAAFIPASAIAAGCRDAEPVLNDTLKDALYALIKQLGQRLGLYGVWQKTLAASGSFAQVEVVFRTSTGLDVWTVRLNWELNKGWACGSSCNADVIKTVNMAISQIWAAMRIPAAAKADASAGSERVF